MAYKKYIQKNGKLYGPYIYHSKRVDGKVISEYYGNKVNKYNYKKFLFIFAGILLFAVLIYFIAFSDRGISGKVALKTDISYEEGKPLEGVLKFSLREGELLPESSKIVFENSGTIQEFVLSDVFEETPLKGDYYVYGKEISGEGLGYGIEGQREIYPEVEFILQIYTESNSVEEITPEETPQETTETGAETTTEEVIAGENSSSEVTGNSIKNSGGIFASFFGFTGRVSMELQNEIEGITSKDKPFIYELKEGETAELKLKSVRIGDEELDDKIVSLKIEEGKAIVTTDYSEIERGYGKDYTGNKEKTISLDLSNLNLYLEKGDLNVKLVYGEEEIVSLTTSLKEGGKTSEETVIDNEEMNEIPIEKNKTLKENINFSFKDVGDFLTPEEREILINKFGNITLENTKSELFKDRIIMGYKFDEYSIEYSYDSSLSKEVLDVQMEKDRIKFLKDIAGSVSKKETLPEKLEGFNETYIPEFFVHKAFF